MIIRLLFALLFLHSFSSFADEGSQSQKNYRILVTVAPHKFFVDKISQGKLKTMLMVPATASSHTFEPTPKHMLEASLSDIWFIIGETFEKKASTSLKGLRPQMKIVDLRQGLDLIHSENGKACCHHHHGSEDVHYWLSIRQAKIQAETIARALITTYPEMKSIFEEGLSRFENDLTALDDEFTAMFKAHPVKYILVSHPAYAYMARDYGFSQVSIEFEGKDPTPKQLIQVLELARKEGIKKVFTQKQYNSKGAKLIANELNAEVIELDPYSEEYFESLKKIVYQFIGQ